MKILIDTNIVLDHMLERKPFHEAAEWIFSMTERGQLETYVCATSVTTVHYLVTKALGVKVGQSSMEILLRLFEVAPVTRTVLASALQTGFDDFEDAVLHEAALHSGLEVIVTRDAKGFQRSKIPVYSSVEFVASFLNEMKALSN